jgi:hypothetical protein
MARSQSSAKMPASPERQVVYPVGVYLVPGIEFGWPAMLFWIPGIDNCAQAITVTVSYDPGCRVQIHNAPVRLSALYVSAGRL